MVKVWDKAQVVRMGFFPMVFAVALSLAACGKATDATSSASKDEVVAAAATPATVVNLKALLPGQQTFCPMICLANGSGGCQMPANCGSTSPEPFEGSLVVFSEDGSWSEDVTTAADGTASVTLPAGGNYSVTLKFSESAYTATATSFSVAAGAVASVDFHVESLATAN